MPTDRRTTFGTVRLLAGFELQVQSRELFMWLAVLVFALLTFGYSANGVIALVGDRGDVPRHAPWALAQAMAGVTAFGQVITAMIAATAVLRDVGTRTQSLMLTSGIRWRDYLVGRFVGTLAVLLLVYAAIPAGLIAGHLVAHAGGDPAVPPIALAAYVWPLLVLVVPNVIVVAAAFFTAGALSGGFGVILLLGVGLVALWQSGIALVERGITAGALVDPFGNAALLHATAGWSVAERTLRAPAMDAWLLANRVSWIVVAFVLLMVTLRVWYPRLPAAGPLGDARRPAGDAPTSLSLRALPTSRGATALQTFAAELRFGWRWVLRERGFVALTLLAVLNAAVNAWSPAAAGGAPVRQAIEFHARMFAILVATIYAGELVWRDRDVRASALLSVLAASPRVRLAGRATGVALALAGLPLALTVTAFVLPLLRGAPIAPLCDARWLLGVSLPSFWGLLAVSLVVHVTVQHKTAAHLLLITAWVLAIALGASELAMPWAAYGRC